MLQDTRPSHDRVGFKIINNPIIIGTSMTHLKFTLPVVDGVNYYVLNLPAALTIQERKLHRDCL
jgi:hypothetical protein